MPELRARHLLPDSRVYLREKHLGVIDYGLHFGDVKPLRQRHGLTVQLSAAYDEHLLRAGTGDLSQRNVKKHRTPRHSLP